MANRTAVLVFAAATAMLLASLSVSAQVALADFSHAHRSYEAALAEIGAIKDAAWSAMDAAAAEAESGIAAATEQGDAEASLDRGVRTVESVYWTAAEDLWLVAEDSGWADPVTAAAWEAAEALEAHGYQLVGSIRGHYEAWVEANSAPDEDAVVADIERKLENGLIMITEIVADTGEALEDADDAAEADTARDAGLSAVDERVGITTNRLDNQLARLPDSSAVQDAHARALEELTAAGAAARGAVADQHSEWIAAHTPTLPPPTIPPTTTTTTVAPTTTTTVAPTTTTTVAPTTTTTVLPSPAQLPPTEPPFKSDAYMPELPDPVVLSAAVSSAQTAESAMATIGLVRRVIDSQLPAVVSTVAVGPLVVLGLIIDAIRAAGALMAVPWLLLGLYMAGLLRRAPSSNPGRVARVSLLGRR